MLTPLIIGSIIGGGIKAVSGIVGGIAAGHAMRKAMRNVEAQKAEEQSLFDRQYNQDYLQRSDVQRLLAQTEESIRNRNRQSAAKEAVMGGDGESSAAAKEANNAEAAAIASQINAQSDAYKQQLMQQHQQQQNLYNQQLNNIQTAKGQNIAKAAGQVGDAAAAAGANIDEYSLYKKGYKES